MKLDVPNKHDCKLDKVPGNFCLNFDDFQLLLIIIDIRIVRNFSHCTEFDSFVAVLYILTAN